MGRAVKAVDADNLHVTLKFLGSTELSLVPEIGGLLEGVAAAEASCVVSVAGLGVFPHAERPNVVWAGLEGAQTLTRLAEQLEEDLEPHGFSRENRPFVPHLTLARIKARPPESLRNLLAPEAKTEFGTATIGHVDLIRSEPGPDGSRYTVLSTAALKGA